MRFKAGVFLVVVLLVCAAPAVVSAMGGQARSGMCDPDDKIINFVLTSKDDRIKQSFKVPVSYMSAAFERSGRNKKSLHLDAMLDTLAPRCQPNGERAPKEGSLQVALSPNLRPEEERRKLVEESYPADKYEDIELPGYPDFFFKSSIHRPKTVEGPVRPGGYLPAYPKKTVNIPVYFDISCAAIGVDIRGLDMCKMSFLYQPDIAVTATFHASQLTKLEQVYLSSINLVNRFHVR